MCKRSVGNIDSAYRRNIVLSVKHGFLMTPVNSKTYELRSHYTSRIQQFQIPQKCGELIVATDSDKANPAWVGDWESEIIHVSMCSSPVYNLTVTPHAGLALSLSVTMINSPRRVDQHKFEIVGFEKCNGFVCIWICRSHQETMFNRKSMNVCSMYYWQNYGRAQILSKDYLFFGSLEKASGSVQPLYFISRRETAISMKKSPHRFKCIQRGIQYETRRHIDKVSWCYLQNVDRLTKIRSSYGLINCQNSNYR